MNKQKLKYIEDELRKVWDNYDFILGITNSFEYEEEMDEMIEFINENKGKNTDPSDYTVAMMNIEHGEGNWENGQLIEIVDDEDADN